jgi:integrase/recombinase XerD
MSFEEYLISRDYSAATVKTYRRRVSHYLQITGEKESPKATYAEVVSALGKVRKYYPHAGTLSGMLIAVKQYYHYLLFTGVRKDHPCKTLRLRDRRSKGIRLHELFTAEELEKLKERQERYKEVEQKNQVLISLLIYQGLTTKELASVEVRDINLQEGTVRVKAGSKTAGRTLPLKSGQIMLFFNYLTYERPKLLKKGKEPTGKLLITCRGSAENGEGIHYLTSQYKTLFKGRKLNPQTIRQSVIANLLKGGRDIREVQAFAGHKYASTTGKYRQSGTAELKEIIEKLHPLG